MLTQINLKLIAIKKATDKAKKEKVQPTKVQNASSQFDDLFNN